ncbi:universal stress protein [Mycobacterium sp. CVI_P3]|uniref:Universal stress protein n=1 Tax=Mycobacterium pinniadriaticum TaxID=2994102 RepID=A0ABT3SAE9_9MYCO|nr:universal stress protein [Mycobacterium pinniadriaticum]MCX2929865.1 universal stress protein [Mycobacterium pinniadriaticum]MCX2936486.1 universal stress protein [Mycobacterium pinniadriaticum]
MTTASNQPAVVVGIDGSDTALGAAGWAAEFATRHALPLTLLHAIPPLDWHFTSADTHAGVDRSADGDGVLAAAEAAVRSTHPDLAIRVAAVKGAVATVLADASRSARLLVVGAGAADHRALGGHAVRIVHRTDCPVVVWRKPVARRTGKPLPVVVGIDESDESARALAEAFDIAGTLHAPLTVVHMWEIGAAVGMGDLGGQGNMDWELLDLLESKQRQRMDELVKPFASKYRNAHVTKVFQDVSPAKGLADLSREAQLVVVGHHGRGKLADAILGSVSQNLIHHAECPVLVVR